MDARRESPYIRGSVMESPVAILLVEAGTRRSAATISFFSEAAHYPATMWVSLAAGSETHSLVEQTGRFSINVLHEKQKDIALLCGAVTGEAPDACSKLDLDTTPDGFLFLRNALASVACRVRSRHAAGDHTLFIADLLSGRLDTRTRIFRHLLISDLVQDA